MIRADGGISRGRRVKTKTKQNAVRTKPNRGARKFKRQALHPGKEWASCAIIFDIRQSFPAAGRGIGPIRPRIPQIMRNRGGASRS